MNELVAWIREQLDDDERLAKATTVHQPYDEWTAVGARGDTDVDHSYWGVVKIARPDPTPAAKALAQHIALHDPARVLRDVEAKRRILDEYERALDRRRLFRDDVASAGALLQMVAVIKLLALPYADRPGYRAEWAP